MTQEPDIGLRFPADDDHPDADRIREFADQIREQLDRTRLAGHFLKTSTFVAVTRGPDHVFVAADPTYQDLVGERRLAGRPAREVLPELEGQGFFELLDRVYETGEPYVGSEESVRLERGPSGEDEEVHVSFSYHPLRDAEGEVAGILAHGVDVTDRVRAREHLRRRASQQEAVAELGRKALAATSPDELFDDAVRTGREVLGADGAALYGHRADRNELVLEAAAGPAGAPWETRSIPVAADAAPGRVFRDREPVLSRSDDAPPEGAGGGVRLTAPVPGVDESPWGVLSVHARDPGAVDEESVPVLEAVANVVGTAVHRQETERFVGTLLHNLPGVVYRCRNDPDWTIERLSDGVRELTGFSREELIGPGEPTWADLIHPGDREQVWRDVQSALERSRPFQLRYRIRARGGEEKWVWEQGRGVRTAVGEAFALEGYVFDITDWREARREADRLESVLRAGLAAMPDAVFVVRHPERVVTACNRAAEEVFGYAAEEMEGASTEMLHVDRESFERFDERAGRALEDEGIFRGEFRMRRKDGSTFPTEHSVILVEAGGGEAERAVSIVRDISDRKRRQRDLERSRDLVRRYAGRITEARERERAELAHEVHDELGQSLTALKMKLTDLRRNAAGGDLPGEELEDGLDLLDETLEQVRNLSSSLRPGTLDQLGLVDALAELVDRFDRRTGIEASFASTAGRVDLGPDRGIHVYRVVQEALTNVARHADADRVRVRLRPGDGRLVARVLDDGSGLEGDPPEASGGFGILGMRERARLLDGDLTVEDRDGRGTVVRLAVPLPTAADDG